MLSEGKTNFNKKEPDKKCKITVPPPHLFEHSLVWIYINSRTPKNHKNN